MGITLPYSSSTPATAPEKLVECRAAGAAVSRLLALDLRPSDILTPAAFRNALVTVMALGGSTNAVLHLLALARTAGVALSLDDIQAVSDATPFIADLKPSGAFVMEDVSKIGALAGRSRRVRGEGVRVFGERGVRQTQSPCKAAVATARKETVLPYLVPSIKTLRPRAPSPRRHPWHPQIPPLQGPPRRQYHDRHRTQPR